MTKSRRISLTAGTLFGVLVLAIAGERLAPPMMAPVGGGSPKGGCDVDAPDALHAAAKKWCASGLFSRAAVTGDDQHVIAVMQFTPNGAQTWQLQSGLLIGEFAGLTNQLAADAPGKNISIDLHDAADRRIGACRRSTTDTASTCGMR